MRILIVDDDPALRSCVRRLLPRVQVDEAGGVPEALAAIERGSYDAVLIDVCLGPHGDRSGLDLARTLRSRDWPGAILLVSGLPGGWIEREALAVGADGWLEKPQFDRTRLRELLEQAVAGRGGKAGLDDPALPASLRARLADVFDCDADQDIVHAEKAWRLVLYATQAKRLVDEGADGDALARAADVSWETIRKYALVGSRWSAAELYQLLVVRRDARGGRLSLSHLHEVARLSSRRRREWVERILAEPLTVRELKEVLEGLKPQQGAGPVPPAATDRGRAGRDRWPPEPTTSP